MKHLKASRSKFISMEFSSAESFSASQTSKQASAYCLIKDAPKQSKVVLVNSKGLEKKEKKGTLFKCLVVLALIITNWGHCKLKLTIYTNKV